jgi:hypothetical protein
VIERARKSIRKRSNNSRSFGRISAQKEDRSGGRVGEEDEDWKAK